MRKHGLASLGFFYHDHNEDEKRSLRGLLSSVLVQLCHQSDSYCNILSEFFSDHSSGSRPPSDDELVDCLKEILGLTGQAPVFLIVDALDECPNTSALPSRRAEVLTLMEELIKLRLPNLRLCVTSRPEADIKSVFDPLASYVVSLHGEKGQMQDINNYIKSVVSTNRQMQKWKPEHKQLVIDALTKAADGM
jgi:hypothetical protein